MMDICEHLKKILLAQVRGYASTQRTHEYGIK